MFTLAETAGGAIVLGAFGEQLSRAVPLAVRADIDYKKLAMGPVVATAEPGRPAPRWSPSSTRASVRSSP